MLAYHFFKNLMSGLIEFFRSGNLNQEANKNTNNSNDYQYIIKEYFRFHILFHEKSAC